MFQFAAHEAKQRFGDLLHCACQSPVEIMKYRRRVAVLVSADEYDQLRARDACAAPPDRNESRICFICARHSIAAARRMMTAAPGRAQIHKRRR